mgnify:CR=1 FL=1
MEIVNVCVWVWECVCVVSINIQRKDDYCINILFYIVFYCNKYVLKIEKNTKI